MKIVEMKPSELKPYARTNRKHPKEQIDKLAKQIAAHGWDVPIVVDKDFVIIKGHGRLKAAKQLKFKTVPVVVRDDLTPEQCNAARLADNKLSELAEVDMEAIQAELDALKEINFDLDLTAFDSWNPFAVDAAEGSEGLTDPDDVPELKPDPKSKLGDVWQLGNHRVMCGDSTDAGSVAILMNGQRAQTFFSDPPYGDNVGGLSPKTGKDREKAIKAGKGLIDRKSFIENDLVIDWLENVFEIVCSFVKEDSTKMVFFKWDKFEQIKKMASCFGEPSALIVWNRVKKASAFFRFQPQHELLFHWGSQSDKKEKSNLSNVWSEPKESENREIHPTVKPIAILEPAIRVTTDIKEIVLDLFLGSGSTLIACEKTGRHCYGIELSPQYVDVILKRWQDFTGKKAVREDGVEFDSLG